MSDGTENSMDLTGLGTAGIVTVPGGDPGVVSNTAPTPTAVPGPDKSPMAIQPPADVPGNHAKLFGMLTGLGVALSASAKSLATHGREGGASDVAAFLQQQAQEKRAKEDQEMKKSDFELRNKAMTAKMNQDTAIYNHNVSQWPAEDRARQIALKDAAVKSFTDEQKSAEEAGYDVSDPAQKAEFEKQASVGGAEQQPGAIVVPLPAGSGTADAVASVRQAIPQGKNSADYVAFPEHTDAQDHSAGGSVTLVPKDAPIMGVPATPRQISSLQAETEGMLTQAKAAGLQDNPLFKQLEGKYNTIKDVIAKGGKPSRLDVWTLHQSINGPLSSLVTSNVKAGAITEQNAKTISAQNAAIESGVKAKNAATDERLSQEEKRGTIAKNAMDLQDKKEENVVAYDPNFQNPDGTKGANVMMARGEAQEKKLDHYKADPSMVNANVAGFNDVQTKINQLATVANDPTKMSKVNPALAAAMLDHAGGIELGAFGMKINTSMINAKLYQEDVKNANPETREYVTAMLAAHEAITQLPRLQTFGKSSRMTQQQMEAAQSMLPSPGDDADMAGRKMNSLQTTIDPLRKQLPHMQGAELTPTWLEQQKSQAPSGATHVFDAASGKAIPADAQRTLKNRAGNATIGYVDKDGKTVLF
jgi:hypothetical protein